MPRENRKRGKKHKKSAPIAEEVPHEQTYEQEQKQPSWIVSQPEQVNQEAPFGYVDADVKAYFRTIDDQLKEWQDNAASVEDEGELDPNEARKMFFVAALSEMSEKEKQLATDPDCSQVMERMTYSMDDFARRVLVDRLTGSYETLIKHRFASHVCQTMFTVASSTVSRETQGSSAAKSHSTDQGELRTMTRLVLDVCEELLPSLPSLLLDPFASHVIRAIILLLAPTIPSAQDRSTLRSKKSAAWKKAKQGDLKSVFSEEKETVRIKSAPPSFNATLRTWVTSIQEQLSGNEVRAMAASKVGSPVLKVLLEAEAHLNMHNIPNSLMDRVSVGLISAHHTGNTSNIEASDYLLTLLRDPTSSHLLESLISLSPEDVFPLLWSIYLEKSLPRLTVHPVANFVVAKALERVTPTMLESICEQMAPDGNWGKVIRANRVGVLKALVDRAATLRSCERQACEAAVEAFGVEEESDRKVFVPCVLYLVPAFEYRQKQNKEQFKSAEPNVQGAILLQSLLRLSSPHNSLVIDSLTSLPMEDLIKLCQHPVSSRVLDVFLESSAVSFKTKRALIMSLIGHFHTLVDDRIGSRVGDRCWAWADTYLKEKIARSLIKYENSLAASFYGKFFARNLNLYLLRKRPDEWRTWQTERAKPAAPVPTPTAPVPATVPVPAEDEPKKKRKREQLQEEDEIDALFSTSLGKKVKKGALEAKPVSTKVDGLDKKLAEAIRAAPRTETGKKHKNKKKV